MNPEIDEKNNQNEEISKPIYLNCSLVVDKQELIVSIRNKRNNAEIKSNQPKIQTEYKDKAAFLGRITEKGELFLESINTSTDLTDISQIHFNNLCFILKSPFQTFQNDEPNRSLQSHMRKNFEEPPKSNMFKKTEKELLLKNTTQKELNVLNFKKTSINNIILELKETEKVDICFMIDCTGSMSPYIQESKMVIFNILDKLKTMFDDLSLRMSFVGYKDHCDGLQRVNVLPFSTDANTFKSYISSISSGGGDDQCEDVFGGLEEVGKLEWCNFSRILFHIGDAPCHGLRFHSGAYDSYPNGDPRGLNITDLLRKLISINVCYYFAQINLSTKKMIEEFDKELIANKGNKINVVKLALATDISDIVAKSITATIMKKKSQCTLEKAKN